MKYRIEFMGRKVGAIGIFYPCAWEGEAESEDAALRQIADNYERLQILSVNGKINPAIRAKLYDLQLSLLTS